MKILSVLVKISWKTETEWNFPVVRYFTWNLECVSYILWMIVVFHRCILIKKMCTQKQTQLIKPLKICIWKGCQFHLSVLHSFTVTAQKMKFSINGFSSKSDQIRRKLRICSRLLEKSLMENFFFLYSVCCLVSRYEELWLFYQL